MSSIHGNIEGLRNALLKELESFYEWEIPRDVFAPQDLVKALWEHSIAINREIALYITRDGDVVDVIVGQTDSVSLRDYRLRRNQKRLSGVRCIHTHPGGSAGLSDVDISALRSLRFDAMAAIGLGAGGKVEVAAGLLDAYENGEYSLRFLGPVACGRLPQEAWMEAIEQADKLVGQGEENDTADDTERAMLVGMESEDSLKELARLAKTAGALVVGTMLQRRQKPENATYIGRGKAEELSLQCQALEADVVIFDDELTGIQMRNLEEILRVKVVDRTTLILDIFAQRASSREGKLQVALAQLTYQSSRLIGQGLVLSRLAGGIGTRGPGESKLEVSRRRIRERMTDVRRELAAMERQRDIRRHSREKNKIPVVALVGYTNAGKSTLLNRLTGADVYVQDQLFATLDATSRKMTFRDGGEFLLVDTVGFIRKLPHTLVEAFKSTLEEAVLADVLLIVSDASSPDVLTQHQVVEEVLASLGATDQPRIDVLNKCDAAEALPPIPGGIAVSAKDGTGLEALLTALSVSLNRMKRPVTLLVPFSQYGLLNELRTLGQIQRETHEDAGTRITVLLEEPDIRRLEGKYPEINFATA